MLVKLKNSDIQFAVLKSCLPGNEIHLNEDRLTIAKMLQDSLDYVSPYHQDIRFVGIQTQGIAVHIYV